MNLQRASVLKNYLITQDNLIEKQDVIVFPHTNNHESILSQEDDSKNALEIGRIYIKQAQQYIEEQDWQQAIIACGNALKTNANQVEAYNIWGNALQKLKRNGEAIGCYAMALEINPNMHETYANLGTLYVEKEQWSEAIEYFEKCIALNPQFVSAYRGLAKIWEKLDEPEKAWSYIFMALDLEPDIMTPRQYCEAANELLDAQKTDKAIAFYRYAIQIDEYFQDAYIQLISVLVRLNKQQEAAAYYDKLTEIKNKLQKSAHSLSSNQPVCKFLSSASKLSIPNQKKGQKLLASDRDPLQLQFSNQKNLLQLEQITNKSPKSNIAQAVPEVNSTSTQLNLCNLHFENRQWNKAIACYQQVIQSNPKLATAYRNLGNAYHAIGRDREAFQAYKKYSLLQGNQLSGEHYLNLGNKLSNQQQVEQAIVCYRQAINIQPNLVAAYLNLGQILEHQNEQQEALNCYRQLLQHEPQNADAYYRLGEINYKRENWDLAEKYYTKVIQLNPHHGQTYHNLGDTLSKQEKLQKAISAYSCALKINPNFFWSYNNLADAYLRLEKWSEAAELYQKAIEINSDFYWSHYNLGESLSKLFRWLEAIAAYHKAIKLKPDFAEAYAHLGEALIREEKWEEGTKYYETAIELNPGIDVAVYRNLKEALDRKKYLSPETDGFKAKQWPYQLVERYLPPDTLPDGSPWPKISIVTPSYNQGEFIEETILSVINQNYPHVEHILIDGSSTDRTMEIVNKYREHFSYVVSEPDKGQSNAINKGFRQATGEIFTWLNSDDRLAPGALYAMALAFYTSGADVVAGVCQIYKEDVEIEQHLTSHSNGKISVDDLLDLENCWLQGKFFYQPEVMFTREIWQRAGGGVNESLYYSMDYEMWVRFAAKGAKLKVIGYPVAQYRMHEQQKTNALEQYRPELLQVRAALQQQYHLSKDSQSKLPTKERRNLKIVVLNDTGFLGGAGIANQRIAQALALAGHNVSKVTGTLDWSLTPVDSSPEDVDKIISSLAPDLLVVGNIHNFQYSIDILEKLSSQYPTIFIMHDQWLFTGRCGYTGECKNYATVCDADCPTWEKYPRLAPSKIAEAFYRKQALIQNSDRFLVLSDSKWLSSWSSYACLKHATPENYLQFNNKFQHLYYGLDLDIFRPQGKNDSRHQLGLPSDKFIILTGSQSLEDERKGFKYLLQALEIANLPDVLVLCFGHDFQLETNLNIKGIGYVKNSSLLALYYGAADLFISPALEEAFGQTFIEAAACGTPAVGYGVGGVKEAICDRVSGRIVNRQTPEALAEVIQELYRDRSQLALLSKLAPWYIANNFSMAASYHSIIDALNNSGWLADLGMAAVSKLAVNNVPQDRYISIKGNNPSSSIGRTDNSLPQEILMDNSLQGSGWHPAENVNDVMARWMTKIGTVFVEPINTKSCPPLLLELRIITAIDLQLLNTIVIKINGNLIPTKVLEQDNNWLCWGEIPLNLLPQQVAFVITVEAAEDKQLSPSDLRRGSLLVERLLIKEKGR